MRHIPDLSKLFLFVVVMSAGLSRVAWPQTYSVIYNFTGGAGGASPESGVTLDSIGNLYGTTDEGGTGGCDSPGCGTVYVLKRSGSAWVASVLHNFTGGEDGSGPDAGVIFGPDGALYGTAALSFGGTKAGPVYRLYPAATACETPPCPWTETALYYPDALPTFADLIFDRNGNLYGTLYDSPLEAGSVYELSPSGGGWTASTLHTFSYGLADGGDPQGGVILDNAGNLYGTTFNGGQFGNGVVYELTYSSGSLWLEDLLHSFSQADGAPLAGLILDESGNLYGATTVGGGGGKVFELSPSLGGWNYNVLYTLGGSAPFGCGPRGNLAMDRMGNLYGAAACGGVYNDGIVFELSPSLGGGWTYKDLHDFDGNDGADPIGRVTLDASGNLYGTALTGGSNGVGVVWQVLSPVLFSDLGPANNPYNCCTGWTISGSGYIGTSFTAANLFTVSGQGSRTVTQIDLAVHIVTGSNSFYATIWTNDGGVPGTQVADAYWPNLTGLDSQSPFGLVTIIPGSGLTLTGGQSYFMILGPTSLTSDTFGAWNFNNQGVNGLDLYSTDGGQTWNSNGSGNPLGAFDVLGQ